MQNSVVMLNFFFVLDRKYPFLRNLVQKVKILSLNWSLVRGLIWLCRFGGDAHFFCFRLEIPILGKFCPENQNYQFKLKFSTYTNLNMHNLLVMLTFFCFWPEIPLFGKFGPKNENCHFKRKFGTLISTCNI